VLRPSSLHCATPSINKLCRRSADIMHVKLGLSPWIRLMGHNVDKGRSMGGSASINNGTSVSVSVPFRAGQGLRSCKISSLILAGRYSKHPPRHDISCFHLQDFYVSEEYNIQSILTQRMPPRRTPTTHTHRPRWESPSPNSSLLTPP
jgi:hypothetical protein